MTESLALVPYFLGGVVLSAAILATLWWNVRGVALRKAATHRLVSGFLVRVVGVSACCVLTMRIAGWAAFAAVIAGFIVGRAVLLRRVGHARRANEASA